MRRLSFLALAIWPGIAAPETQECGNGLVSVETGTPGFAAQVCAAADHALEVFSECAVPLPAPVRVRSVNALPPGCVALYDCSDSHIEILRPDIFRATLGQDALFASLPPDRYYASVIVHELAHAATRDLPCPFGNCRATAEYLAFALQIMSLSPQDRERVENNIEMGAEISFEEISELLYYMAPNRFAAKAWAHLNQRPDVCAFVAQIVAGEVHFEQVHP